MPETDALFHSTFRHSPIGMLVLDRDGHCLDLNPAFARILDQDAPTLRGRHFSEYTHPDDCARDAELLTQLIEGSQPSYQVQKRYQDRRGDSVWCRVTVTHVDGYSHNPEARFVAQVEDITEFRRAKDLLENRAHYDGLTGLPNGTLIAECLTRALAAARGHERTVGVLFIDVDHFNLINDSLGREAGDTLIAEIGKRIVSAVRPGDTVGRLAGDEFVIVLEDVPSPSSAEAIASAVASAVHAPIQVAGHDLVPTISIGIALANGDVTAEGLIRDADTAMYAAKEAGRARIEFFTQDMREHALNKLSIEAELRTAMREGELVVHYQPLVDLETREVIAFEALVRWQHPTRGLLQPDEFIEISEEANLVAPLGAYVLLEACEFIARHPEFTGRVFVNVSARQIGPADLTRAVQSALSTTGVPARRICLEITESGMLMTSKVARADLDNIVALGVDLVLDDFGTGYSALSSILQNPVAGLKLSREFTSRLGGHSGDRISQAVATLTVSLGMYGVVEGVETEAQHRRAHQHGWRYGQGFLYGRPMPEDSITFEAASDPLTTRVRNPGGTL